MSNLYYVTASTGETVKLEDSWVATDGALDIRGSNVDVDLGYRDIESWSRPAYSKTLDVVFTDKDKADELVEAIDADYESKTPGTFYGGGWSQRGYLVTQDPKKISPSTLTLSVRCVFLDGVWRKPRLIHLFPNSGDMDGTKRYHYAYPYKYASEYGARIITVQTKRPVSFLMCIFGSVQNPSVRIGNNTYSVRVTVPSGGYLLLDSRDASATLVTKDGIRTDVYRECVRGKGDGSGTYAWEKIPSGVSFARWDDTFGFDLTLFEERSAPPFGSGL